MAFRCSFFGARKIFIIFVSFFSQFLASARKRLNIFHAYFASVIIVASRIFIIFISKTTFSNKKFTFHFLCLILSLEFFAKMFFLSLLIEW